MASILAEAGASEFDSSDLPPTLRHSTVTGKTLLRVLECLLSLSQQSSETASRRPRGHARTRRIIRLKTVLSRTGLSRSTIYRKIIEGTFPPQIRISIHGAGWRESDINRWIADPVSWRPKSDFE